MNIGRIFDGRLFKNGYRFVGGDDIQYQLDLPKGEAMKVAAIAEAAPKGFKSLCYTKWRADGSLRCFFTERDGVIEDADEETLRRQMRETKDWKEGVEQGWISEDFINGPCVYSFLHFLSVR